MVDGHGQVAEGVDAVHRGVVDAVGAPDDVVVGAGHHRAPEQLAGLVQHLHPRLGHLVAAERIELVGIRRHHATHGDELHPIYPHLLVRGEVPVEVAVGGDDGVDEVEADVVVARPAPWKTGSLLTPRMVSKRVLKP